jgi:hypothetical protein
MCNGKQQDANPDWNVTKGKYGVSYMTTGQSLNVGEWISSDDGRMQLIMQPDGNLVLYGCKLQSTCSQQSYGMGGNATTNAIYQMDSVGNTNLLESIGVVDFNSVLHKYPLSRLGFGTGYSVVYNKDTPGNDIPGAAYQGATVEQCENTCNSRSDCYGFVMSKSTSKCWPKTSGMYPYTPSNIIDDPNSNTYIRSTKVAIPPPGISTSTTGIDSVQYANYPKGDDITNSSSFGLAYLTQIHKSQLEQLYNQLTSIATQINSQNFKIEKDMAEVIQQTLIDRGALDDYLLHYEAIQKKIDGGSGYVSKNIDNIVNDSDIVVLQENYNYLFWTILAIGTLLVSINVFKK